MKTTLFALSLMVMFCACKSETAPPPTIEGQIDTKACTESGGTPTAGLTGLVCAQPEPDAGKACNNSNECSGFCLAETKTCSFVRPYFGCHTTYENGATPTVCVD